MRKENRNQSRNPGPMSGQKERSRIMENKMVFVESESLDEVPFTTSDIIAEYTGNGYRSVQRIIERQMSRLERFARVRFEITPLQTRGGVQNHKVYLLSEQQATLLITFLKNTDQVADFKTELVSQFYAMRKELTRRAIARESRKPVRLEMTDAIRDFVPDSPHKSMMYPNYSKLAYKTALGKDIKTLRAEKGAPPSGNLAEYLTAEETEAVKKMEGRIATLLEMGFSYQEIKELCTRRAALIAGRKALK